MYLKEFLKNFKKFEKMKKNSNFFKWLQIFVGGVEWVPEHYLTSKESLQVIFELIELFEITFQKSFFFGPINQFWTLGSYESS